MAQHLQQKLDEKTVQSKANVMFVVSFTRPDGNKEDIDIPISAWAFHSRGGESSKAFALGDKIVNVPETDLTANPEGGSAEVPEGFGAFFKELYDKKYDTKKGLTFMFTSNKIPKTFRNVVIQPLTVNGLDASFTLSFTGEFDAGETFTT